MGLQYYRPGLRGVIADVGESGTFPVGTECWRFPDALPTQLMMEDGQVRPATTEEAYCNEHPTDSVVVTQKDDSNSTKWRRKIQKEIDAEAVAATQAELDRQAAAVQAEIDRQANKSDALKNVENGFLSLCEVLTSSKKKLGFTELQVSISALLADPATKEQGDLLFKQFTAICLEGMREGGNLWWDDITWHAEIK